MNADLLTGQLRKVESGKVEMFSISFSENKTCSKLRKGRLLRNIEDIACFEARNKIRKMYEQFRQSKELIHFCISTGYNY